MNSPVNHQVIHNELGLSDAVNNPVYRQSYPRWIGTGVVHICVGSEPGWNRICVGLEPVLRWIGTAYVPLAQCWRGLQRPSCIHLYIKQILYQKIPVFSGSIRWITQND
jgi:hypothetical protein